MNMRALLVIAVASLLTAACGERVQIGSEVPVPPPVPPDPDLCTGVPCGQPCRFDTPCSNTDCPPSPGGFCDLHGVCSLAMPVCADPGMSCVGLPCGAPCGPVPCDPCEPPPPCDPAVPNCTVSTEPTMRCDAFEQCQSGKVDCPL